MGKTWKQRIEENAVLIVLGAAVAGFSAGFGSYKVILETRNEETVIKGTYVLKEDLQKDDSAGKSEGEVVIRKFFHELNARDFDDAWDLIHRKHKEEIQRTLPNATAFGHKYDTTGLHENVHVDLDKRDGQSESYFVSYDVSDTVPRSTLYDNQDKLAKELFDAGMLSEIKVVDAVFDDIGRYYDIKESDRPMLQRTIESARVQSLFSPLFLSDAADTLKLEKLRAFDLTPKREVWRHYVLDITLMPDDGNLKIMSGLYPPEGSGLYSPGAKIPSK